MCRDALVLIAFVIGIEHGIAKRIINAGLPNSHCSIRNHLYLSPKSGRQIRRPISLRRMRGDTAPQISTIGINISYSHCETRLPQPAFLRRGNLQQLFICDSAICNSSTKNKSQRFRQGIFRI